MEILTLLFIVLAVIAALGIALLQYFYKSVSKSKGIMLLALLRFLGTFAILLLFINPKIKNNILEIEKPTLAVAIDNSSSIKFLESDNDVAKLLSEIQSNKELNDKFSIDYFAFDAKLNMLDSLTFDKNRTNLRKVLVSLDEVYKKDAAVLLVTDGNQTLGSDYRFHKSNVPVFPIVLGDTLKHVDLEISRLNANKYSYLGNNFPVEVFVNYNGKNRINPVLTVKNGNTTVFRKNLQLNSEKNSEQIVFNLTASQVGILNFRATITYLEGEQNTINNHKNFSVEVIDEQSKIAIISDIKHPDLGMLKRAIESNKQRKVVYLSSNTDSNELATCQLAIVYQPTEDFRKIFEILEDKEINSFIITGTQTEWNFLNEIQSNFKKSVISQTENYAANFNDDYSAFVVNDLDFETLPPLHAFFGEVVFSSVHESLLFQNIGDFKTESPLLATYLVNNRRGAVLFGENSWKWRALSFNKTKSFEDFDSFINKLIQYLAVKKAFNRIELDYDPIVYQNDLIKISANYFDSNYTLDARAKLVLTLKNMQTNESSQYPLILEKNGFTINLNQLESGDYNFSVKVEGQNILKNGRFTVLDYNIEQQFTYANIDGLQNIALASGGKVSHISQNSEVLRQLTEDARYKSVQKNTEKIVPIIDWKWLLGLIVLFFSAEWFIRKYRGLI